MAMGNLNKSKEATQTATIKGSTLGDHYSQKLESSLLDQNLLSKSASECEDCAARFAPAETVFQLFLEMKVETSKFRVLAS